MKSEESDEEEGHHLHQDAPSLQDVSMKTILSNISPFEADLQHLPMKLKSRILSLMSKRGLLNDSNIKYLLHQEILELDLTESSVTDASILGIKKCKYLQKLDLNSMKKSRNNISSEKLEELFQSLSYLRILYLRRCMLIDDKAICAAAKCRFLSELNLSGCVLVSDKSLIALSKFAPMLKSVNLSHTKVSDYGLSCLANGVSSKKLIEIQVPYCENVTDDGISFLRDSCPHLSILIFHGCPLISSDFVNSNWQGNTNIPMKMVTWTVY